MANHEKKLMALPVQIISVDDGVHLLRGSIEIRIKGYKSAEAVDNVLRLASERAVSRDEIVDMFAAPDRPAIDNLVSHLIERGILSYGEDEVRSTNSTESELDIFYWQFGEKSQRVIERFNDHHIAVMGINRISMQMANLLPASGIERFELVDDQFLRNLRLFRDDKLDLDLWPKSLKSPISRADWMDKANFEKPDCIVATSDFGTTPAIGYWNEFCIKHKIKFLPIVLDRLIGYIGPMVIPGETACYECMRRRENSNIPNSALVRTSESTAFDGQFVKGFHPSMASTLADIGTLELSRFYSGIYTIFPGAGNLLEIKLLVPEIKARPVLKLPRCPVCSPLKNRASVTLDRVSIPDSVIAQHSA